MFCAENAGRGAAQGLGNASVLGPDKVVDALAEPPAVLLGGVGEPVDAV